jgi:hypothetical protein
MIQSGIGRLADHGCIESRESMKKAFSFTCQAGCVALLVSSAWVSACSAAGSDTAFGNGQGGSDNSNTGGTLGNINPAGGSGPGGPNCGGDHYEAQARQLDIYVMFDDSGSMIPWWPSVTQAFTQFLNDPRSAGIGVGIQFFGEICDVNHYATPKVPIAPLPQNAAAIQGAIPFFPIEQTATDPALRGAIQHARAWQTAHPDHKVVVLLITDGEPSECMSTVASVSQVATEGVSQNPSIPTFVLGLGLNLTNIHQIAQAGGTNQAFIVDPNSGAAFTQAMNSIRGQALPCDYALPNSGNVDPQKVNIEFTPVGGAPRLVVHVGDAANCDPNTGGWYYDNPTAPTRAIVCPQTCQSFTAEAGGAVNVVLGCDIVVT